MMRGAVMMAEAAGAGSVAVPVLPVDAVQVDGGGSVPWAGRRAADLPWPDGLAFGMRQAEVQALVPAAVPPRRDGDWAVLAEDRMAVQVLAAMVAGQEGMGGRSRLVEPVTVAGLALDAHHHFVMNRLTVVLAMPTQGWMAHEQAMAAHASLGQWLTARHGQPRVVQAPGWGRRVQVSTASGRCRTAARSCWWCCRAAAVAPCWLWGCGSDRTGPLLHQVWQRRRHVVPMRGIFTGFCTSAGLPSVTIHLRF